MTIQQLFRKGKNSRIKISTFSAEDLAIDAMPSIQAEGPYTALAYEDYALWKLEAILAKLKHEQWLLSGSISLGDKRVSVLEGQITLVRSTIHRLWGEELRSRVMDLPDDDEGCW